MKTSSTLISKRMSHPVLMLLCLVALYAPAKDFASFVEEQFSQHTIHLTNISFGGSLPWQTTQQTNGFQKVSMNHLNQPQRIYTKLSLSNPTNKTVTYRRIWLSFTHENGNVEHTTDYQLYDVETRSRLIGKTIELGPNSHIEVLASYRFIPSYSESVPTKMSVSWEGSDLLRRAECDYEVNPNSFNSFNKTCL